uniref:Uncharacterized protein n=1 Tax=Picea glauca TaxID=3330 RepID=A0A101LYG8_PICGL|nr:hypothetical protein ABT39_MTgene5798 [Picea glauca]
MDMHDPATYTMSCGQSTYLIIQPIRQIDLIIQPISWAVVLQSAPSVDRSALGSIHPLSLGWARPLGWLKKERE